jgi:anaerobic selenocysteine-containing dehydrogenase
VELAEDDAKRLGVTDGDVVEVSTPRGSVTAKARIGGIRTGVLFIPFHYGYWDVETRSDGHHRAANELTPTQWDPASKQPIFKTAAAQARRVHAGEPTEAPQESASTMVVELLPHGAGSS